MSIPTSLPAGATIQFSLAPTAYCLIAGCTVIIDGIPIVVGSVAQQFGPYAGGKNVRAIGSVGGGSCTNFDNAFDNRPLVHRDATGAVDGLIDPATNIEVNLGDLAGGVSIATFNGALVLKADLAALQTLAAQVTAMQAAINILTGTSPLLLAGTPVTTGSTSAFASFAVTGSGGTAPYTYSLVNAPSGMAINSSGVVSWANPTAGTYTGIAARVTDAAGAHTDITFSLVITSVVATLAISGTPTTTGTTSAYTSFNVAASGGVGPYSFSLVGAPTGMTVVGSGSTGTVSYASPTAGTYTGIVVRVTDSLGSHADLTAFAVTISAAVDSRPRYGVAPAAASFVGATVFAALSPIPSSANGGKTGTFNTPITTQGQAGWVAVLASNASVTFIDAFGAVGGWSGANSGVGNFGGNDISPTTISQTWTDPNTGLAWRFFRESYTNAHSSAAYQFSIS